MPMSARVEPGRTGPRVGTWAAGERRAGQARAGPRDLGRSQAAPWAGLGPWGGSCKDSWGLPPPPAPAREWAPRPSPARRPSTRRLQGAVRCHRRGRRLGPPRPPPAQGLHGVIPSVEASPLASWTVPGLVCGEDGGGGGLTLTAAVKGERRLQGGPSVCRDPRCSPEGDEKASEGLLGARSCLRLICGVLGPRPLKERGVLGGWEGTEPLPLSQAPTSGSLSPGAAYPLLQVLEVFSPVVVVLSCVSPALREHPQFSKSFAC